MINESLQIEKNGRTIVDFKYYERVNEIRGGSGSGKSKLIADVDALITNNDYIKQMWDDIQ